MSTTVTTLSGLQEQIIADSTALFRTTSDLFNAVYNESAGSATSVKFSVRSVPAAASAQANENDLIVPTVITVGEVIAALQTVPVLARVSKLSATAPGASMKVAQALSGSIARAIDTSISAINFNTVIGDGLVATSLEDFFNASADLSATGFIGQKVALYHPKAFAQVGKDLLALVNPNMKSAEYMSNGYVATIGGVEIYVSPWIPVAGGVAKNKMFFKEAIGLGYREPIIDINSGMNLERASFDVLADSYFVVSKLVDIAGVNLQAKI